MTSLEPVEQKAKRLVADMRKKRPNGGWGACEAALVVGLTQIRRLKALEMGVASVLPNGETVIVRLDTTGRYVVSAKAPGEEQARTLVTVSYK